MRLNLKATDVTLDFATREYLTKRLASLEKFIDFNDPAVLVNAELGRTTRHHHAGNIFFAEVTIHRGKESFRSVSDRPDLFSAIDEVRDELERALSAKKGKMRALARRGAGLAKAILKGGQSGLAYMGRPAEAGRRLAQAGFGRAKAGWRYVKTFRLWRK